MSDSKNKITLMIPGASRGELSYEDRGGGEEYSLREAARLITATKEIDAETIEKHIDGIIGQIHGILGKISSKVTGNWKVQNISVGLSLNAEGSIGIATAGVETSIEICFTPK